MNWLLFLTILIQVESNGDPMSVGDLNLKHHAYGVCQIRQPYLEDVNAISHTTYTIEQIKASETLSKWAVMVYVKHYGQRYTRLTGKPLTMEVAARIHCGGPDGWKKKATDAYWEKFSRELSKQPKQPRPFKVVSGLYAATERVP
jgi:hypothetical protein